MWTSQIKVQITLPDSQLKSFQVACHIEDVPENGADIAHLAAIHETSIFGGGEPSEWSKRLSMWSWHEFTVQWKPKFQPDDELRDKNDKGVKMHHAT